jgi:hypothetical protein
MNSMMKTVFAVVATTVLLGMPNGKANAGTIADCSRLYRECLAAGYEQIDCENGYWICRIGYIPVKSNGIPSTEHRRN